MIRSRLDNVLLAAILLLYLLVTVGYSIVNPLFEAPDEHFHFFTIHAIASTGKLPVIPETYDDLLGPEPAQPPLYYVLAAPIMAAFDTDAARTQVQLNPFAWIGSADAVVNVNRSLITQWELWPWQGYALAGHLIRGLSTLFGLGTLLCIYASARLLWPENGRFPLLATALIAFLPQFNFIHSAITNDALITLLASASIWQLVRLWQTGVTCRRLLALGITIGLAALTKNAGVLLLPYAIGFLFLSALRELDLSKHIKRWGVETAVFVILPVLLMAGWLWVRNLNLYGDFTAANQFVEIAGGDRGYTLRQVLVESDGLWLSFFAVFGWFNVSAPPWVYTIWNGIVLLAAASVFFAAIAALPYRVIIWKHPQESVITWIQRLLSQPWMPGVLLAGWLLAVYLGLVTFMMQTEAAQGRLLFPAIVPIALGVAFGLSKLQMRIIEWTAANLALATTVACLLLVIRPTYTLPNTVATLPVDATPLGKLLSDGVELVGTRVETKTAVPGDIVWYTLYWRIAEPTTAMPAFKFEIFGRDLTEPIGEIHTFHGRGLYPPNVWPVGEIIADRFPVRLDSEIDTPVLARGFARLVPSDADETSGGDQGVFAGAVKITPAVWPEAATAPVAKLGDVIGVTAVSASTNTTQPGDTLVIDVTWQVTGSPAQDYATLIHLAPANMPPLAQGDAHPRSGTYPTRIWSAGEVIEDQYTLTIPHDLPPGCYPLWLGMYEVDSFVRLPLTVNDQRQPNDVYQIGDICVGES